MLRFAVSRIVTTYWISKKYISSCHLRLFLKLQQTQDVTLSTRIAKKYLERCETTFLL